jgi:release factor glutamine methyltransferase
MSEQIDSAIRWGCGYIEDCSDSARLDAELLLAHCLDKPRSYLYSWPEKAISDSCWRRFQDLVWRRIKPTPVAYLLGSREFYSMEFAINPSVLVPRPETELLVDLALRYCPTDSKANILELGTGSGIIAITLKQQRPLASLLATDIDPACISLARDNALHHNLDIEFIESNWFSRIPGTRAFDLIVSNPPYIAAHHPFLNLGDLPAEPAIALSPGDTGLEALQVIVSQAGKHLVAGGYLMFEHGYDQQAAVHELLEKYGYDGIGCEFDSNDLPRVSMGRKPGQGDKSDSA